MPVGVSVAVKVMDDPTNELLCAEDVSAAVRLFLKAASMMASEVLLS